MDSLLCPEGFIISGCLFVIFTRAEHDHETLIDIHNIVSLEKNRRKCPQL